MLTKDDCDILLSQEESRGILLEMLDDLVAWCEQHGLKYYLSGGTLLGAIRHRGFIPWDDDIDVNMSRPDADKLYNLSKGNIGKYFISKGGTDPYSPACQWYRLYNPEVIVENYQGSENERPIYHPLFIDIFPIEGFPQRDKETKRYCKKLIAIRKMLGVSWHPLIMKKNIKYAILNLIFYIPAKLVGYRKWASIFQREAQRYDFETCEYVGVTTTTHYLPREKVIKREYINGVEVDFEGKRYRAPGNYDTYLRNLYGDYMKIPPKDKQQSGHIFKVYRAR